MKILHLVESFASGTRQIVRSLANYQVKQGHDVHVWFGINAYTPADPLEGFEDAVQSWKVPHLGSRKLRGLLFSSYALLARRNERFDVLHLHSSVAGFLGRVLLSPLGHLTVLTPHGSAFLQSHRSLWWRQVIGALEVAANAVCPSVTVACSESEGRAIELNLPRVRLEVIPNGCSEICKDACAPDVEPKSGRVTAVAIGRISVQKNFQELRVLSPLLGSEFSLTVVGGGDPLQEKGLKSCGIAVTGWLREAGVRAYLKKSDLLVVSSLWEGMPLAVIEAMSLGIPVVARKAPGVVDLVEHDVTGFLYTSPEELSFYIEKLLRSSELILRLGRSARNAYLRHYQCQTMCIAYENLYREPPSEG